MDGLRPSRALFEKLVKEAPEELLAWVRAREFDPPVMTFALEILGSHESPEVTAVLLEFTRDDSALVREGAVLGLFQQIRTAEIERELLRLSREDRSPGVRGTALDGIES